MAAAVAWFFGMAVCWDSTLRAAYGMAVTVLEARAWRKRASIIFGQWREQGEG